MRVLLGVFAVGYLLIRLPVFLELGRRDPAAFDPVGLLASADSPMPRWLLIAALAATIVAGAAFTLGAVFRVAGPAFGLGLLVLMTYRSSWGQMLHFENMIVLLVAVIGLAPAADVWSVDARRRPRPLRARIAYGFPLWLACVVVCVTYLIAGIAKIRIGGVDWVVGDTLRNHVAYSAARLELLGGQPSPLAGIVVPHGWIFPPMAAFAVAVELGAPVALLGGRLRTAWVAAAWAMHAGIFALMLVGFPAPLFGVAFAPFFRLERGASTVGRSVRRLQRSVGSVLSSP